MSVVEAAFPTASPHSDTEFEISDVFSVYLAIFRNILLFCKATEVPVVVSCVGGGSGFSDGISAF